MLKKDSYNANEEIEYLYDKLSCIETLRVREKKKKKEKVSD